MIGSRRLDQRGTFRCGIHGSFLSGLMGIYDTATGLKKYGKHICHSSIFQCLLRCDFIIPKRSSHMPLHLQPSLFTSTEEYVNLTRLTMFPF